ncbi:hypothetical protein CsatA_018853 [Cannabis sativa]
MINPKTTSIKGTLDHTRSLSREIPKNSNPRVQDLKASAPNLSSPCSCKERKSVSE